jgi:GT2 family glycosyltransferase
MASEPSASEPSVSVIVPVYNQREYLAETFNCLMGQTYENVEVIFVDDGSTDGSGALLDSLVGDEGLVIHQTNGGLSAARNAGLRRAGGDFVQFLDADDLIDEKKLAHDVAYLAAHPEVDMVSCQVSYFRDTLARGRRAEAVGPFRDLRVALLGGNRLQVHAPLVRRAGLELSGGFDESLTSCEDWDFWLRWAEAGLRAEFVPGVRAFTRLHGGRMSGDTARMLAGGRLVLSRARRIAGARHNDPAVAFALAVSHTAWCLKAQDDRNARLAGEFGDPVAAWIRALPTGFVHSEFSAAEHLALWTRVLLVFRDEPAMVERAREEWHQTVERIGRAPDAAGIRALLAAQQTFLHYEDDSYRELAVLAGAHATRMRPVTARRMSSTTGRDGAPHRRDSGDGAHVEEVLAELRERVNPSPAQNKYYVPGKRGEGILIYGGGAHTHWLLSEFNLDGLPLMGIVDDDARLWGSSILGLPVMSPQSAAEVGCETVLISSDEHEERLAERARRVFPEAQVYRLYGTSSGLCEPVSAHCPS